MTPDHETLARLLAAMTPREAEAVTDRAQALREEADAKWIREVSYRIHCNNCEGTGKRRDGISCSCPGTRGWLYACPTAIPWQEYDRRYWNSVELTREDR